MARAETPVFDERFIGFGMTRNTQVMMMMMIVMMMIMMIIIVMMMIMMMIVMMTMTNDLGNG